MIHVGHSGSVSRHVAVAGQTGFILTKREPA